ncbi:MAG: TonB-dependent receptor [Granulosicoccus sp.]|nr:TonB-dependent receptor [Granulosicoccus sp.]
MQQIIVLPEASRMAFDDRHRSVVAVLIMSAIMLPFLPTKSAMAQETSVELEAVVVEGEDNPEPAMPLGIGISGETLSTAPGSGGDPLRTIQSIPGMAFTEDESALPAVRGSRPDDNYFQTDFVPTGYLFHAGGAISVYNPSLVKSFSIYPSAYGAEFFGVTGGVFDVELRDPKSDRFHATVDLSFLHAGALIEGPVGNNQSFYLGGRFSLLDIFVEGQLPEEDGVQFTQFPRYTDYQGKYIWELHFAGKLTAQINGASDELDVIVDSDSEAIDTEPVFAGRNFEKTSFNEQSLIWDLPVSDRLSLKTALSHSNDSEKGQAGGAGNFSVKDDSWLLKSRARLDLSERHEIVAGAQVSRSEADIDVEFNAPACSEFEADCQISNADRLSTVETIDLTAVQAYVQDSWSVTDQLTLFPGITVHTENYLDEQFVEPRLALEYSLSDSLILSAGSGIYHQFPGFLEVNRVFGNPDLEYIESVQGVVGLQKTFSHGWDIKTELYYKQLKNLVSGNEVSRYDNNGEGEAYGLDLLVRKSLTDRASGWLSASFSEATRKDAGGNSFIFEYDQPYNVSLVGQYKLSEKWSIGAKYWLHSGAPYTPIVGATADETVAGLYNPEYGDLNSARFPAYRRLDVRLDRTIKRSKGRTMSAYIEVLNLLGNRNVAEFDYSADYSTKESVEQLPRFLALGFKATY